MSPPTHSCTLCNSSAVKQRVSFVAHERLWTVEIFMCESPKCLEARGATSVEMRGLSAG